MTSEEDKRLLARISQLAGQINRHKNQTSGATPVPNAQHRCPYPSIQPDAPLPVYRVAKQKAVSPYGSPYGSRPASPHVRGGGYRRSGVQHRHKSLVLNGASAPSQPPTDSSDASSSDQQPTWVSKTDRHLQLINSSVYEKDSQTRAKAIAETIQQKRQRQDDREKVKLKQFLQAGSAGPTTIATATVRSANEPGAFELDIEGIRFRVAKDGSKLVKLSDDINPPSATPKTAVVGGVKFFRSKTGNLYRDGIVKAHRQSGKVKKVDTPCKTFSTTGNSHSHSLRTPSRRILSQSLLWIQEMMRGAPVCRQFALFGYCDKASQCPERHVFECPDFSNTGKCKTKGCKLVHRERASVLRKVDQRDDDTQSTEDLSSDDDSVASDDVDSDEVEEFVGDDNVDQSAFKEQRDYISF